MPRNQHPHNDVVKMVSDDMTSVIQSFKDGPKFMDQTKSPSTEARLALVANAAPDIRALDGTLSKGLLERLARLDGD